MNSGQLDSPNRLSVRKMSADLLRMKRQLQALRVAVATFYTISPHFSP